MKVFLIVIGLFLSLQAQAGEYAPYVACYVVPQYTTNYLKDDGGNNVGLVYKKQTAGDYSQKFVVKGKTVQLLIEENSAGISNISFYTEIESGSGKNDIFISLGADVAYRNVEYAMPLIEISEERYIVMCKEMSQSRLP